MSLFDDCFDRDSLTKRLLDARENNPIRTSEKETEQSTATPPPPVAAAAEPVPSENESDLASEQSPANDDKNVFDREATLAELRTQRIKSLREQLSKYNVRWGNMIEKEDLVKALCDALEDRFMRSKNFSRSGNVLVGEVCDANEDDLMKELGWLDSDLDKGVVTVSDGSNPTSHVPLLLDVYATW